ncbi:MAG: hypothetical protein IPK60_23170 [Sandaracinaceae bacterium]|nr:hypothetical protein [Sandaracinaceae bacterium]
MKSLSPPEVVQALLDGKEVVRTIGWKYRFTRGAFEVDTHDRLGWRSCTLGVHELLLTASTTWSIVPDTYDWAEARKRMAAGKMVRSLSSPDDGSPGSYLCRQNEYGLYVREDGLAYEFNKADFDGEWTDA